MSGLNDLADADTGLVATPEARQPAARAQPRLRQAADPMVVVEQPAVAAPADTADPAPRKTRAPRKPKVDAGGSDPGGDGPAAAE